MKNKGKALKTLREEVELLRMDLALLQAQFAAHLRDHQPTPPNIYPNPWTPTQPNTWPYIISDTQSGRGLQTCVFGTGHLNPDERKSNDDNVTVIGNHIPRKTRTA